jgi:hypothetical protein
MLALSASHLMITSTSPIASEALTYRILAIKGLNTALSTPPTCKEEADAILATCWTLLFQTTYLGDSVEEFLTMLRGCNLIVSQNWRERFGTSFQRLSDEGQDEIILPVLKKEPLLRADLVREAWESVEVMRDLKIEGVEEEVFRLLSEMVRLLSISSLEGMSPYYFFEIDEGGLMWSKHISSTKKSISFSLSSPTPHSNHSSNPQTPLRKSS